MTTRVLPYIITLVCIIMAIASHTLAPFLVIVAFFAGRLRQLNTTP